MMYRLHSFIIYTAAAILLLTGCRTAEQQKTVLQPVAKQKNTLQSAIETAVRKNADLRVMESLQTIAREHVEKKKLLELPDMIYDLPRRLYELRTGNDYRLQILDHALESCRILTRQAKHDLNRIQREVEVRKIAYEQSVKWSTLDYINNLKKAGIDNLSLRSMRRDVILELSISSGIKEEDIANFDFSSLPEPFELKFKEPPAYVKQIHKLHNNAPDAALRFADIVYRLPTELLHRKDSNFNASFELALAAGTAIKQHIVKQHADAAWKNFEAARKKNMASDQFNKLFYSDLEQAKLEWRTAYFRSQYDQLPYPEKIDQKELTFLIDLISLQGK